jgi:hypothetical protein
LEDGVQNIGKFEEEISGLTETGCPRAKQLRRSSYSETTTEPTRTGSRRESPKVKLFFTTKEAI